MAQKKTSRSRKSSNVYEVVSRMGAEHAAKTVEDRAIKVGLEVLNGPGSSKDKAQKAAVVLEGAAHVSTALRGIAK